MSYCKHEGHRLNQTDAQNQLVNLKLNNEFRNKACNEYNSQYRIYYVLFGEDKQYKRNKARMLLPFP